MSRRNQPLNSAGIIGGGIGGIATATLLAKAGLHVEVFEKQPSLGGRAGLLEADGFRFDTGPSWFLMPEIFEHYFELVGTSLDKELELERLSPGYKVFFENAEPITVQGDLDKDAATFEAIEPGAGDRLRTYVGRAEQAYTAATKSFLYTNFDSPRSLLNRTSLTAGPRMLRMALTDIDSYVSNLFKDRRLKQILEYPMVFLGSSPYEAPALYQLMSFLDFKQGVYYPQGGMYRLIERMHALAEQSGVVFHTGTDVTAIVTQDGHATGIRLADGAVRGFDVIVSNADLHHTETQLLPEEARSYPQQYWDKRQPGPSALLMYLGVKGKLPELEHHNLLFTDDWKTNFGSIFDDKRWPEPASIYLCKPSASDKTVAPDGHENLFILVPMQADETVTQTDLEVHADRYLAQIEAMTGINDLRQRIVYRSFRGPSDFADRYNAWHGTALGLSHRLTQSAFLRPGNKSKRLDNLYYAGGNTVPGIGLPMCLISAELVYKRLAGDKNSSASRHINRLDGAGDD